jgi:hypothetical protein
MGEQGSKSTASADGTSSTPAQTTQSPQGGERLDSNSLRAEAQGLRARANNVRQPAASANNDRRTDGAQKAVAVHGWPQIIWERWRWGVVLFFALIVSRLSSVS